MDHKVNKKRELKEIWTECKWKHDISKVIIASGKIYLQHWPSILELRKVLNQVPQH